MISALLVIGGVLGMELFVVLFHRFVMHGFLWRIHITHHRPTDHPLELNDVFVVFFMSIALSLMWFGFPIGWPFWIGVGVAVYGTAYFVMHDMIIHKRFLRQPLPKSRYLQAVWRMHMAHHKHVDHRIGEAYGMFIVTPKYWKSTTR